MGLRVLCGAKKNKLKLFNHGKKRHLEQDSEHFNHRTHRHRNHLRGDFVHGRVIRHKKSPRSPHGNMVIHYLLTYYKIIQQEPTCNELEKR